MSTTKAFKCQEHEPDDVYLVGFGTRKWNDNKVRLFNFGGQVDIKC